MAILVSALLRTGAKYLERNRMYLSRGNKHAQSSENISQENESNSHATKGNISFGSSGRLPHVEGTQETRGTHHDAALWAHSCYVPFAYLFNEQCRHEAKKRPLFTIDDLLRVMN